MQKPALERILESVILIHKDQKENFVILLEASLHNEFRFFINVSFRHVSKTDHPKLIQRQKLFWQVLKQLHADLTETAKTFNHRPFKVVYEDVEKNQIAFDFDFRKNHDKHDVYEAKHGRRKCLQDKNFLESRKEWKKQNPHLNTEGTAQNVRDGTAFNTKKGCTVNELKPVANHKRCSFWKNGALVVGEEHEEYKAWTQLNPNDTTLQGTEFDVIEGKSFVSNRGCTKSDLAKYYKSQE